MVDEGSKIKDLTSKTPIVATDEFVINDVAGGNLDKKAVASVIKTYFSLSPVLVTPNLGTPSAGVLTNATGTAAGLTAGNVTTNANLTGDVTSVGNAATIASGLDATKIADGTVTSAEFQFINSLTSNAQDQIDAKGAGDALTSNPLSQFAATTSAQLAGVISNETGSGLLVFGTSPTLVTPALGTPSALVGTNVTGLPVTALANGTDGELITWGADAVATTVAVGTATHVLTSNGVGTAPTFQAPAAGGIAAVVDDTTPQLGGDLDGNGFGIGLDDAKSLILGTGSDASLVYDGTDLVISPALVGTGDLVVTGGGITMDQDEKIIFGNTLASLDADTNSINFNIPTGWKYFFNIAAAESYTVDASFLTLQTQGIIMQSGKTLYFDGGGHTWIQQPSNDLLILNVGGEYGLRLDEIGTEINVVLGAANALATTATDGFLYLPTMAGTPTGNSTDYTGKLPIVYDSSNSKLYINTGTTTWAEIGAAPTTTSLSFSTIFETAARFGKTEGNGGTRNIDASGCYLESSATSGGYASNKVGNNSWLNSDWATWTLNYKVSFFSDIFNDGSDYDMFIGMGDATVATTGITYTPKHFGFKWTRASSGTTTVAATNADGTTETSTDVETTAAARACVIISTSASIKFYLNETLEATHTTNLPTGSITTQSHSMGCSNKENASNATVACTGYSIEVYN